MSHMIEMKNGVASFAENGRRERAWHGLGQVVDEPMFVKDALKLCHADYNVGLQPIIAVTDDLLNAIHNGEMIDGSMLSNLFVDGRMATVRTDSNTALGLTSDSYGIV